jgi:hypothetical protein
MSIATRFVRTPRTASVFGPRRRAGGGATYPSRRIASRTEATVSRLIPGRPFTTRATVEIDTPAASATFDIDIVFKIIVFFVFVNEIAKKLAYQKCGGRIVLIFTRLINGKYKCKYILQAPFYRFGGAWRIRRKLSSRSGRRE